MVAPKMDFNRVSQPARLQFIKTIERDGQVYAIIADRSVLGDDGIRSFKQALSAGQAPRVREGVHAFTAAQLMGRLPDLKAQENLAPSVASFERALECIAEKQAPAAPRQKAAFSAAPA